MPFREVSVFVLQETGHELSERFNPPAGPPARPTGGDGAVAAGRIRHTLHAASRRRRLRSAPELCLGRSRRDLHPLRPEGRKLHCLRECDRVTFCIVGKTQVLPARFTTFYESILLDCRARTGLTAEERRRALDHLIGKYSPEYKTIGRQYVEKSFHRTEIIRLDILSWSGKCKDNLHPGATPPGANSNRT